MFDFNERCNSAKKALESGIIINDASMYLATENLSDGTVLPVHSIEDGLVFVRNTDIAAAGGCQIIGDPDYLYAFCFEDYTLPVRSAFYYWNRIKSSRALGAMQ